MCFRGDPWGKGQLGLNRKPEKVGRLVGQQSWNGRDGGKAPRRMRWRRRAHNVPEPPEGPAPTVVKGSPPAVGLSYEPSPPTCEQFLASKVILLDLSSFVSSKKVTGVCRGAGQRDGSSPQTQATLPVGAGG